MLMSTILFIAFVIFYTYSATLQSNVFNVLMFIFLIVSVLTFLLSLYYSKVIAHK